MASFTEIPETNASAATKNAGKDRKRQMAQASTAYADLFAAESGQAAEVGDGRQGP